MVWNPHTWSTAYSLMNIFSPYGHIWRPCLLRLGSWQHGTGLLRHGSKSGSSLPGRRVHTYFMLTCLFCFQTREYLKNTIRKRAHRKSIKKVLLNAGWYDRAFNKENVLMGVRYLLILTGAMVHQGWPQHMFSKLILSYGTSGAIKQRVPLCTSRVSYPYHWILQSAIWHLGLAWAMA